MFNRSWSGFFRSKTTNLKEKKPKYLLKITNIPRNLEENNNVENPRNIFDIAEKFLWIMVNCSTLSEIVTLTFHLPHRRRRSISWCERKKKKKSNRLLRDDAKR